jgi:hypothetical protein
MRANFQRIVTKLSKQWAWDPGSGKNLFRIQGSKRHRIRIRIRITIKNFIALIVNRIRTFTNIWGDYQPYLFVNIEFLLLLKLALASSYFVPYMFLFDFHIAISYKHSN